MKLKVRNYNAHKENNKISRTLYIAYIKYIYYIMYIKLN